MTWRDRLREAVTRSGRKHYLIAEDAGVTGATLSNVMKDGSNPHFGTVVRIAHAVGVNVGWLLREKGYDLTPVETGEILKMLRGLEDTFTKKGGG